jgi:hypothetical protein
VDERIHLELLGGSARISREELRVYVESNRLQTDAIASEGASSDSKLMVRLFTLDIGRAAICGVLNRPFTLRLSDGRLRPPDVLQYRLGALRLLFQAYRELEAIPQYRFSGTVYRGVKIAHNPDYLNKYNDYRNAYALDKLVTFGPFMSCTLHDHIAASADFLDRLLFQFINARGVRISHLSEYAGEGEVLIAPPSVFKVVAHSKIGASVTITLEQVDTPLTYL